MKTKHLEHLKGLLFGLKTCPEMYAATPKEFQSLVFGLTVGIPIILNSNSIWENECRKEYNSDNKNPNWELIGFNETVKFCCMVLEKVIKEYENEI